MKTSSLKTIDAGRLALRWLNDYSPEQVENFRQKELWNAISDKTPYYSLFLEKGEFKEPVRLVGESDIDTLILITKNLLKNIWWKNRYPEYYSKQWGNLSIQFHQYWSDLLFLKEIQSGDRPISQLIHIFRYD